MGSQETVRDDMCLCNKRYISHEQCYENCMAFQHRGVIGGECVQNVCFCKVTNPGECFAFTFISLSTFAYIDRQTTQHYLQVSNRRDRNNACREISQMDTPWVLNVPEPVFQSQRLSPSEELGIREMPKEDFEEQCEQECVREPSPEPEVHDLSSPNVESEAPAEVAGAEECPVVKPSKKMCKHNGQSITEDDCEGLCLLFGAFNDVDVRGGFCFNDACYCIHHLRGFRQESRLYSLEQHKSQITTREFASSLASNMVMDLDTDDQLCTYTSRRQLSM
ncbi:hypothetical protein QAD02_006881 [Eretmocerus hayati]|uniref:Uncharacterized protein n=1 Tax=Eretmocerus hayati TaxID=131215 RepID=A0ACC2N2D8_9HYME|nr:hypothetical protein QAD02_006881 [Eretmocerus hayati]